MQAVQEEGGHIQPEAVLGAVQVEGAVGDEQHPDLPGKQLEHQEPHRRDHQGDGGGHAVGLPHPKKMLCPEVVAVDGLHGGGDAHKHGVGDLIHLHHHSIDREGDVAAVHAGRSVDPQQVVQGDLHQGGEDLGQQAGNPQGQNPPGELGGGAQGLAPEPDCVQPGQIDQKQHPGRHLADDRSNAGPHHSHSQGEDEDGVQDQIEDGTGDHAAHAVPGVAVRPDDGGEGRADQLEGQPPGDGPEIGSSLRPGGIRSAEEPGDLGGEAPADDGRAEAAGGDQGDGVTDGVVRLLLLAAAEAQADVGGAAVPQQQGHGVHQNDHRERHVDGRHGGDPHALAHEDLVHDVVEAVDHQRQGRGNGVADDQFLNRLGLQRAAGLLIGRHTDLLPSGGRRARRDKKSQRQGAALPAGYASSFSQHSTGGGKSQRAGRRPVHRMFSKPPPDAGNLLAAGPIYIDVQAVRPGVPARRARCAKFTRKRMEHT